MCQNHLNFVISGFPGRNNDLKNFGSLFLSFGSIQLEVHFSI